MIAWVLVAGTFFFTVTNDVHWPPWLWVAWTISGFLIYKLYKGGAPKLPLALFAYLLFNGITAFQFRPITQGYDQETIVTLRLLAAHATFELLLLGGFFYTQWQKLRPRTEIFLVVGVLHSLVLIFDTAFPGREMMGLLGNRSIGASFLAVWVFFMLHSLRQDIVSLTCIALGAITITICKSGISYLALLIGILTTTISWLGNKGILRGYHLLPIFALFMAALGIGDSIKPNFFGLQTRYQAWPMFMTYVETNYNLIVGAGLGSFKHIGPMAQLENEFMVGRWWLWAHNDWLQILLETGIIGLILSIAVFVQMLWKSSDKPFLFGAVNAFGIIMLGNYPLHIAATSLLAWWIGFEVYSREKV